VFGGMNEDEQPLGDVYMLQLAPTTTWSKMRFELAHSRGWHSSVAFKNGEGEDWVLALGGQVSDASGGLRWSSNLECLDVNAKVWFEPHVSGKPPSPRGGHTMVAHGQQVVVFGGCKDRKWCNDCIVLDTGRWAWSHPHTTGVAPLGCSYHSAVLFGDTMLVFGGNNDTQSFNRIYALNLSTWNWSMPAITGEPPLPRTGHVAVKVDACQLVVYGGWDPDPESDGDEHNPSHEDGFVYNVLTGAWTPLNMDGLGPPKGCTGAGQSSCLMTNASAQLDRDSEPEGEGKVLIFGGRNGEDLSSKMWTLTRTT